MNKRATQFLARCSIPLLRAYMRYVPVRLGKAALWTHIIDRHVLWRPHSATVRIRAGAKIRISFPDQMQQRLYFFGLWEPCISTYITRNLQPGDCFIDVGANIGYYSLVAASAVGVSGCVSAVEASPSIFRELQHNISINGYTNIAVHCEAASNRSGTRELYKAPSVNLGATTLVPSMMSTSGFALEASVSCRPLCEIVGERRLLSARIVKIDTEGSEADVIEGIEHLLPKFSPRTEWIIELNPAAMVSQGQSAAAVLEKFRVAGYRAYRLLNRYSDDFYLERVKNCDISPLAEAPSIQTDILLSKR